MFLCWVVEWVCHALLRKFSTSKSCSRKFFHFSHVLLLIFEWVLYFYFHPKLKLGFNSAFLYSNDQFLHQLFSFQDHLLHISNTFNTFISIESCKKYYPILKVIGTMFKIKLPDNKYLDLYIEKLSLLQPLLPYHCLFLWAINCTRNCFFQIFVRKCLKTINHFPNMSVRFKILY